MATSSAGLREGSDKNIATYSFTEDGKTKHIQRVAMGGSDGSDVIGTISSSAIKSDTAGTIMGFLRGIVAMLSVNFGGEDSDQNRVLAEQRFNSSGVITTDTAYMAVSGFIHTVTLSCADSAPTAGTIDVYDNPSAASGKKLFSTSITTSWFAPLSIQINSECSGIYVKFTTTADVNVFISAREDV